MECEICGKKMTTFTHLVIDDEVKTVCYACRDREDLMADYEYQRQKEEENG